MAFEQRDNSGALFKNEKKETLDQPDYKGTITIGGVSYWLSAWIKTSAAGNKFMSIAAKRKDEPAKIPAKSLAEEMDDEIPF